MNKWDYVTEMCNAEVLGKSMGLNQGDTIALQVQFVQRRKQEEQLAQDLEKMYALAKYLHAHGQPITNKKALRLLKRHGYDVSAFED